jgi:hypothetical protein
MIRDGERGRIPGQLRGLGGQGEAVILAVSLEDPELKDIVKYFYFYLLHLNLI